MGLFFLVFVSSYWALIIQGDELSLQKEVQQEIYGNPFVFDEFWTDCVLMEKYLTAGGVPKEKIITLWGEGENWGIGRPEIPPEYWVEIVDAPATFQAFDSIVNYLSLNLTQNDILFIYTFDHGGTQGNHVSTLQLLDREIADTTFARLVDKIPYMVRVVLMQQCFSGGFIDNLENEKTIILTSTRFDMPAWRADDIVYKEGPQIRGWENQIYQDSFIVHHGEFNFHLFTAFSGGEMPSHYIPGPIFRDSIDLNKDNRISLAETYSWIIRRDSRPEIPQFSDLGMIAPYFFIWPEISCDFCLEEITLKPSIIISNVGQIVKFYFFPAKKFNLKIYSVDGRLILSETTFKKILNLKKGVYIYIIETKNLEKKGKIIIF
jgi:hypothetical protein